MIFDVGFDMSSDTPSGKDPDKFSPTLHRYHQELWSKPLPDGTRFTLADNRPRGYLHHRSILGEFDLSSDAICTTYSHAARMTPIRSLVEPDAMAKLYSLCSTIGGYVIFPRKMIDGKQNINQARGCHPKIRDRIDLTLECIRRNYAGQDNPLHPVLRRYGDFFALFQSFEGYVDFFLLNDLVYGDAVKFLLPFDNFKSDGYPKDFAEYQTLMDGIRDFVSSRNNRISRL